MPAKSPSATALLSLLISSVVATQAAAEQHSLGAHEHGIAQLQLATSGQQLLVNFEVPAESIVGFEHAPSNDAQRAAITQASTQLSAAWLTPSASAQCKITSQSVDFQVLDGSAEEGLEAGGHDEHDHDEHKDHAHETHAEHDHDEHKDHAHEAHAEHDEHKGHDHEAHDEHDHAEGESHAAFMVQQQWQCSSLGKLETVDISLFSQFERLSRIDWQLVSDSHQDAGQLTRPDSTIALDH